MDFRCQVLKLTFLALNLWNLPQIALLMDWELILAEGNRNGTSCFYGPGLEQNISHVMYMMGWGELSIRSCHSRSKSIDRI